MRNRAVWRLVRNFKRVRIPQILKFDDSPRGFSLHFSPFGVVLAKNAVLLRNFRGPPGVFAKFNEGCRGVFRKSARGFQNKVQSLVLNSLPKLNLLTLVLLLNPWPSTILAAAVVYSCASNRRYPRNLILAAWSETGPADGSN